MGRVPRGKFIGEPIGSPPANDAEHFFQCKLCGTWVDMRDMGMVFDHEAPLPHPAEDKPQ